MKGKMFRSLASILLVPFLFAALFMLFFVFIKREDS